MTVSRTEFTRLTVYVDRLSTKRSRPSQMTFLLKKFIQSCQAEHRDRTETERGSSLPLQTSSHPVPPTSQVRPSPSI